MDSVLKSFGNKTIIDTEIIVFDNGSVDGSKTMLDNFKKAHQGRVSFKIIKCEKNLGFSKANNAAVKEANGRVLLFLNSDTIAIDDAVVRFYNFFNSQQNSFNFLGAKLFEKDGVTPQASCGPYYSLPIIFISLFLQGDYFKISRYSPDTIKTVDWVSGACFMCNKKDYVSLEGFDEDIFMYMEEIDLFLRARKKKMRIGFYPKAKFIHLASASSKSRSEPIIQVYKGFLYLYKKHHSPFALNVLKYMLKLKAGIALSIAAATGNQYLKKTYGEAIKLDKMA